MRKIMEFPIAHKDAVQTVELPRGAEIVRLTTKEVTKPWHDGALEIREEELRFLAIVDPEAPKQYRRLVCVATEEEIQANIREYVDTVVTKEGKTLHLVEVG